MLQLLLSRISGVHVMLALVVATSVCFGLAMFEHQRARTHREAAERFEEQLHDAQDELVRKDAVIGKQDVRLKEWSSLAMKYQDAMDIAKGQRVTYETEVNKLVRELNQRRDQDNASTDCTKLRAMDFGVCPALAVWLRERAASGVPR